CESRVLAQILLVDLALMADNERHHAGVAIIRWHGDGGEAGDHVAVNDVVVAPARRILALPREDAIVVALVGIAGLVLGQVARLLGDEGPEGARLVRIILRLPVETVLLAGAADELLGIFEDIVAVAIRAGILHLGIDIGAESLYGGQLV